MAEPMMRRTAEPTNKYGMKWTRLEPMPGGGMRAVCDRENCAWVREVAGPATAGEWSAWTDDVNAHRHFSSADEDTEAAMMRWFQLAVCPSHESLYHSLEPCRVRQIRARVTS